MAPASTPASSSVLATRSAPRLVRVKTSARHRRVVEQLDQHVALLRRVDEHHPLLDAVDGRRRRRHRDPDRIVQQLAGELANLGRHRRREEQVLPLLRQVAHDAADRREEAEVEHLVGLVEHQHFDRAQIGDARVEMIEQPARRGDQHVDAAPKRADLRAVRHAAEDDRDLERKPVGEARKLSAIWLASSRVGLSTSTRRRRAAPGAGRRRAGGGSAGRRPRSCRCRSGRCRPDRGPSSRADRLRLNRGRTRVAEFGQRGIEGRGEAEPVKIIQFEVFQDAAAAQNARYAAWGLRGGNAPRVRASMRIL